MGTVTAGLSTVLPQHSSDRVLRVSFRRAAEHPQQRNEVAIATPPTVYASMAVDVEQSVARDISAHGSSVANARFSDVDTFDEDDTTKNFDRLRQEAHVYVCRGESEQQTDRYWW